MSGLRAFELYHPVVLACYASAILALSMAAIHPVFLLLSLLSALFHCACSRGIRFAACQLAWIIPLVLVVGAVNGLSAQQGSTLLFVWGGHRGFFLESAVYGLLMGVMLSAVLLWFFDFAQVFSSDVWMQLTGSTLPTVGLATSMIARLVPRLRKKGGEVFGLHDACTAAGTHGKHPRNAMRFSVRRWLRRVADFCTVLNVLMGWALEDSLDTAASMQARGWGVSKRRMSYRRLGFKWRDGLVLGLLLALIAGSAIAAVLAVRSFACYPLITPLFLPNYLVFYLGLLFFPLALEVGARCFR